MNFESFLKYLLVLFFSFQFGTAYPQFFLSGEDPASLKWNQINTENFQLIFPEGFEKQAQYFANALNQAYDLATKSLKTSPRKISVLIHNQSVISNGLTAWAPRRIDAHVTPPQDSYADHWFNQLAVHEFRHVVQMERINTGLRKIWGILLGEQAAVAVTGLYLPKWFLEGDAVVMETALSRSGRGRLASFEMPLKAQLLEKGMFTYEKATHASFKDFTPNSYELGYQIVAYARSKYGSKIWDDALENSARTPLSFTPFSSSIKKTTGLSKREFYTESMNFLKEKWREIQDEIKTSDYHSITPKSDHFTNYLNPVCQSEGAVIAFKTSMDELSKIVKIDPSGNEQALKILGPSNIESLSLGGKLLCWAEIEPDARWSNRNYSVIKLYNLETGVFTSLTSKSRYFSPQINRQGTKIAAVEVRSDKKYFLVILDVFNGKEIYRYEARDASFLMHPTWSENGNEIVMSVLNEKGKNIRILHLENERTDDILEFSFSEISRPQLIDDRVFFIANYSGIDNLYAVDIHTKEIRQITSVNFGVGNYSFNSPKDQVVFSNYSSGGFGLSTQKIDVQKEISLSDIQRKRFGFEDELLVQEKGIVEVDTSKTIPYAVKKYPKSSGLFNFHSWVPLSIDMGDYETMPGIMFMSQNILSTAITTVGYEWDLDEKVGTYYANFEYRGWYPVVDFNIEYGKRKDYFRFTDTYSGLMGFRRYSVDEFESKIGLKLPLNFSKNNLISGLTPFTYFSNTHQSYPEGYPEDFQESTYQSMEYGLSAYLYTRSSLRDLYPKWGGTAIIRYTHAPFSSSLNKNMVSLRAVTYVPGFMKHHGIRIWGGFQLRNDKSHSFSNHIPFIRGMSRPRLDDLYRLSVDYKFPLCYPDWDLNSVVYLKRVTMALFYDYGHGKILDLSGDCHSLGTEFQAQMHILSFIAPVNLGFRAIYLPDFNDYELSAFVSIDFSVLY